MRYPIALEFVGGARDGMVELAWLPGNPGRTYYLPTLEGALPLQRLGDPPGEEELVPVNYKVFDRQDECRLVDGILANVFKERIE